MRKLLLFLLVTFQLATGQTPASNPASSLVGRWRSVETSKGGIGAVYYFREDGVIEFSPGAIVDMPYRLEGDQVIFPPGTTNGPEIKSTLSWAGDGVMRLTTQGQVAGQGQVAEYQRRSASFDTREPMLGEWLGSREMNGQRMAEQMFFYPGGRSLLIILFKTERGRYSVTNGHLVAEFGGQVGLDGPFEVTNSVLSITRSRGRVTKLTRY